MTNVADSNKSRNLQIYMTISRNQAYLVNYQEQASRTKRKGFRWSVEAVEMVETSL